MASKRNRIAKRMRDFQRWATRKAHRIASNGGSEAKVKHAEWLAECGRVNAEANERRAEPTDGG